ARDRKEFARKVELIPSMGNRGVRHTLHEILKIGQLGSRREEYEMTNQERGHLVEREGAGWRDDNDYVHRRRLAARGTGDCVEVISAQSLTCKLNSVVDHAHAGEHDHVGPKFAGRFYIKALKFCHEYLDG